LLNSESAKARFPFSKTPENLVVGVGAGVADGEVVVVGAGEVEVVGVGVGEETGVGVGEGEIVGVNEASPDPGQVWERRIPESEPFIVASEPA
jgi:hypothetical protein